MTQPQEEDKARYVARMFARIASRYDLLNTVMTGGVHHRWRREAARLAAQGLEGVALDVATGTGDFAFALLRHQGIQKVVALDLVYEMLRIAEAKSRRRGLEKRVLLVQGDALQLPFASQSFACAVSGFGLRNVTDVGRAVGEMARVVRRGGRVVLLELSPIPWPRPWRWFFRWYFHGIVPFIGAILARDWKAYRYLPRSVEGFFTPEQVTHLMEEVGLKDIRVLRRGLGSVTIHVGFVP